MSAPFLWVFLPLLVCILLSFIPRERTVAIQGGLFSALLALIAFVVPIDTALVLGPFSLKISASVEFLGRSFRFGAADGPVLAMIYGLAAIWFFGVEAAGAGRRFVPLGMAIVALLVASIAVEPFLFAALLIVIAAMLAVPLFVLNGRPAGRGIIRFLIYQMLAMPFILFSGWMLAGVEASPGDIALTTQSGIMLGLGFAFLLGIFPLYSWIPMLADETSPYVLGFMLWALPTFAVILAVGFMDRYAWLRTSPQLAGGIRLAGLLMFLSGGWFAAFERHLGRMMGYAAIAGTGLAVAGLSSGSLISVELVLLLFLARGVELAVWALALATIRPAADSLRFKATQGTARAYPLGAAGLVLAHLSMAGLPLLAGFPARLGLWQQVGGRSIGLAVWLIFGFLGLLIGAIRTLAVLVMAPENTPWQIRESRAQTIMLALGIAALVVLGLFPQLLKPIISQLPRMFEHLAQ